MESIAKKSDGVHFVQLRVMVEDENVQRMVIGKEGANIDWMRAHFRASYAKHYGVEVEIHARIMVRQKRLMRDEEHMEGAYHVQEGKDVMSMLRKQFQKQGKFIK